MKHYYRDPQVEEGIRNVLLQNRCGNRLTVLMHEDHTELDLCYKPNAFRRKDLWARTFSGRDNVTDVFGRLTLPEITAAMAGQFDYDPFVTRIHTEAPSLAANVLTFVNIADENCFALAARCPLLICVEPHEAFEVADGLITESFIDRGEPIVSFLSFTSFEENRFRVLDDGRHVIQIFENEVVLVGAEDAEHQVGRVLEKLAGLSLDELIERNEQIVAPEMRKGAMALGDADLQRVIDLNRRLVWSALDEGGACFGALTRIYHLVWVRDGSMSNAHLALAGNPRFIDLWAPLLIRHPSIRMDNDGNTVEEFLQVVGSRWTKTEDDGLFYAVYSLYNHWQTTGDDTLLGEADLPRVLEILDAYLATRLDERGIIGSETRGEDTLRSSPYFGYDIVNGTMGRRPAGDSHGEKTLARSYSLYNNICTYNVLRMIDVLRAASPAESVCLDDRYGRIADQLAEAIDRHFLRDDGLYRADLAVYDDGSEQYIEFDTLEGDHWEYAWAVSQGPYHPNRPAALRSARWAMVTWPTIKSYGYCPWNTLGRMLREFGQPSAEWLARQRDQLDEALLCSQRFAMPGAVTEYHGQTEGWRGLPFGVGSLVLATCGLTLQPLAQGLAVRGSALCDSLTDFRWRCCRIDVTVRGDGDAAGEVRLNGRPLVGTLQLPEAGLRTGANRVEVTRGEGPTGPRLYSSTAILRAARAFHGKCELELAGAGPVEMIFEGLDDQSALTIVDSAGTAATASAEPVLDTGKTLLRLPAGEWTVTFPAG